MSEQTDSWIEMPDWDAATEDLYEEHLDRWGHPNDGRTERELEADLDEAQRLLAANDLYPLPRSHEDESEADALRHEIAELKRRLGD